MFRSSFRRLPRLLLECFRAFGPDGLHRRFMPLARISLSRRGLSMPFEGTMKSRGSSFSLKRPDGGTRAAFRRLWSCRPACVLNFTLCFLLASRRMPDLSSAAAISRGRGGPWISRWRWPTQSIWLRSFFFANEFTRLCAVRCPFSSILPGTLELFFLWHVVIPSVS